MNDNPFIYTGNTFRLHNLIKKAEQNKPISLVFLGASITLGYLIEKQHQFTNIITNDLIEKFHNTNITCHNLSMAGMSSLHGLYISYHELEDYSPDLIVLDYSVNDQKNPPYRDGFESLIVKCLTLPSQPAVISFFVKRLNGYTCAPQMAAACKHYGIPYVNIGDWLMKDIQLQKIRWKDFSYDDCHPGPVGHNYIGRCLRHLLEQCAQNPSENYSLPRKGLFNNSLANLTFYSDGWINTASSPASVLEFDACCNILFIVYMVDTCSDFGKACVLVDGRPFHALDSYRVHEWNHPAQEIVYLSTQKSPHHISVKMQQGEEHKYFHLVCLGAT